MLLETVYCMIAVSDKIVSISEKIYFRYSQEVYRGGMVFLGSLQQMQPQCTWDTKRGRNWRLQNLWRKTVREVLQAYLWQNPKLGWLLCELIFVLHITSYSVVFRAQRHLVIHLRRIKVRCNYFCLYNQSVKSFPFDFQIDCKLSCIRGK